MLDLISDRIRLAYLKTPDERVRTDDLSPAPPDQLLEDNNFVFVRDTPHYRVYTEQWLPSCREALKHKYGSSSNATIKREMPPRFKKIGEEIGMRMKSCELVRDYDPYEEEYLDSSVVVYAKPTKKKSRKARRPTATLRGIR